ncbi:type II secretion system protein GspG [Haloferula sp.]|uniref:type II secretion system protein GspG n=1 Tax=Haloferula sp. TaxID=2497595 RepID=UPI003C78CFBA
MIAPTLAHGSGNRLSGDFLTLGAAVRMYKITTGNLPHPEEGLQALVVRPSSLPSDREWIKLFDEVPLDPWGNQYLYVAGGGFPDGFGFYSTGLDGISSSQGNDADDWNSWSEDHRGFDVGLAQHWRRIGLILAGASAFSLFGGYLVGRNRKTPNKA